MRSIGRSRRSVILVAMSLAVLTTLLAPGQAGAHHDRIHGPAQANSAVASSPNNLFPMVCTATTTVPTVTEATEDTDPPGARFKVRPFTVSTCEGGALASGATVRLSFWKEDPAFAGGNGASYTQIGTTKTQLCSPVDLAVGCRVQFDDEVLITHDDNARYVVVGNHYWERVAGAGWSVIQPDMCSIQDADTVLCGAWADLFI